MAEYIDRQLCEIVAEYDKDYRLVVPLSKIRRFPTSDVAPVVHGKWIEKTYETTSARGRKIKNTKNSCSVCQESNGRNKTDYCSRCGAKMDL